MKTEIIEIIKQCTVTDNIVKLPNITLDRKEYLDIKKKFNQIGGKWKGGKISGFVFKTSPLEIIEDIINGGESNLKKKYQFFETPKEIGERLIYLANLQENDIILEPSAGQGALINLINRKVSVTPDCCEIMDYNVKVLNESNLKFNLVGSDFIEYNTDKKYTKIIANPPFSKNKDIIHLRKMYDMLSEFGILVCITSNSWRNGNHKKQVEFREWLDSEPYTYEIYDLDSGTFKDSGTNVTSNIIVIYK